MNRKMLVGWQMFGIMVVTVIAATGAWADSATVSYQGVLRDAALAPVPDGTYPMQFSIWDAAAGGNQHWGPEAHNVTTRNGLFSVYLGSNVALGTVFADYPALWLEIAANTGSGLEVYSPRVPLASVPYARHAANAANATNATNAVNATNADNADTVDGQDASAFAAASHNHDAGAIITGTLNTARYSAYTDLSAEGKIGATAAQVAAGNHTHALDDLSNVNAPSPAAGQALTWEPAASQWQAVGGHAIIRDQKPTGTAGGNSLDGGWNIRTLNTIDSTIPGVSLSGNTNFTLPPGRYWISASAPSYRSDGTKAVLWNVNSNTAAIVGTSEYSQDNDDYAGVRSFIYGSLTLTANTTFQIKHWTAQGRSGNGLGLVANSPGQPEVYTIVAIEKY